MKDAFSRRVGSVLSLTSSSFQVDDNVATLSQMRLKFKFKDGTQKVLDLDPRAAVEDVIRAVGGGGRFVFGMPPQPLELYRTKPLRETPLKDGDVLWVSDLPKATKQATGSSEQISSGTTRTVIDLLSSDEEDDDGVTPASKQGASSSTAQAQRPASSSSVAPARAMSAISASTTSHQVRIHQASPSSSSIHDQKRARLIDHPSSPPLFYQNPVEELGIPESERAVTRSLWSLVVGDHLKEAIILNYCVDLEQIVKPFFPQLRKVPVALCCASGFGVTPETFNDCFPEVGSRLVFPKCPPYGTHHSKMFVLFYGERGVRVIIHTSNLEFTNLFMQTEGSWVQDFPFRGRSASMVATSSNDFERYLGRVLVASGIAEAPALLSKYDFSTAEVALVATIPKVPNGGAYSTPGEISQVGLGRVQHLLQRERALNPDWAQKIKTWPVVLQGSSLGSQASRVSPSANWLVDELGFAMGARNADQVELVVVTQQEMEDSHFGMDGAQATFFKREHFELPVVKRILRKWTPSNHSLPTRSLLLPHFKSYTCYEPSSNGARRELAWAMIGSHNCTKAAWGSWTSSARDKLTCLSYELSVMFLPSVLKAAGTKRWSVVLNDWMDVPLRTSLVVDCSTTNTAEAVVPIPFRLPTTKYNFREEVPYCRD